MEMPILSVVIWLPIFGGLLVLAAGERAGLGRWLALGAAILTFAASIPLYTLFDASTAAMQFVERAP